MADNESLSVEVRAEIGKIKSDLNAIKNEAVKAANSIQTTFNSKQLKFDTKIASMNIDQLKNKLKELEEAKSRIDRSKISVGSYTELERRINTTKDSIKVLDSTTKQTTSSVGGLSTIIKGIGAGIGISTFISTMSQAVQEAREAKMVYAQVAQAIRSNGREGETTARQMKGLADEMEGIANIDGDQIMKESILQLLTFKNISGDTFKQATQAALDLSATMGNDLQGATLMIGKALNSPKEGVSALTRVGIQFDEKQKAMIENFLSMNDLAGAQSIILGELNNQFGGQAKVLGQADDGAAKLSVTWGNFLEMLGGITGKVIAPVIIGLNALLSVFKNVESISPAEAFKETTAELKQMNDTLIPAAKEYDKLKGKANLTKDEQVRLNTALSTISDIMPGAITQFDEYGKALSANTSLIYDNIEALKTRLEYENREAISDEENLLKAYKAEYKQLQDNQKAQLAFQKNAKEGTVYAQAGGAKNIQDIITQTNKDMMELGKNIAGSEERIKHLKGADINTNKTKTTTGGGIGISDDQKQLLTDYYNGVKFQDTEYYNFRLSLIDEQSAKYKSAGLSELQIAKYVNDEKKRLALDQLNWEQGQSKINSLDKRAGLKTNDKGEKYIADTPPINTAKDMVKGMAPKSMNPAMSEEELEKIKENQDRYTQVVADAEQQRNDIVNSFSEMGAQAFESNFDALIMGEKNIGQAAADMAKDYGRAILDMIAKTSMLEAITAGFNLITGGTGGWLTKLLTPSAHDGGTFQNGKKIQGFAAGGDFIVPGGFPNDSYPIMVESGERVQVTPAYAAGQDGKLLAQVVSSIQAMNYNITKTINKSNKSFELDGKIKGQDIYMSNRKSSRQNKRYT